MVSSIAFFANLLLVFVFALGFATAILFCKFWLYRREIKRGRSFSLVVHQLKSPLSAIKWTIDMMKKGELGPITEDQKTFLGKAGDSLDRMSNMIFDILEAHSILEGPTAFELEKVNLVELTDSVISDMIGSAREKKVDLDFLHEGEEIMVSADRNKLRVVIENLIDNAIKYSNDSGQVVVRLITNDKKQAILSITDHGIGIPEQDQDKIFVKYFRSQSAKQHESDGSGLGLYVAREIAQKHGGDITFTSKPGETRFVLDLPLV